VWGRIAARELGVPVITTEHNMNIEEGKTKHWVKKKLNKYSAVYTACSRAVATYAEEAYALPKKKMVVVRPGVVLDRFSQLASPVFEKKPVRFLLLGRLTKQKGHRLAIHALSHIPTKDWRLTIAGDGEDSGELLALVRRLGLSDVIRMLPGTRDIEDLYRKSNVVIVPSLWEGLGIVAMEGMAAGRLVIGAKTGGLPEVISHKKTGLLFRAGDVAALRDVIGYALSHLEACRQIARMGQAHAIQHFGVSSMARRYESLYRGMVGNKS
jgi:glycosyltransferase involved in cell wall biosynthesis